MCGVDAYYCGSADSCLHPEKRITSAPLQSGGFATRFPEVHLCQPARNAFNAGLWAPPGCLAALHRNVRDARFCMPCLAHLHIFSALHGSIETFWIRAVGIQNSAGVVLPWLGPNNTYISSGPPADAFIDTKEYTRMVMAVHIYNREVKSSPAPQQLRVIPTGQVIPRYFDKQPLAHGDSTIDRYKRAFTISNNWMLRLPLAYESREQYIQRQQNAAIRPGVLRAILIDEYIAWSADLSTPPSFPIEKASLHELEVCRLEYHPPFPNYAYPNNDPETRFLDSGVMLALADPVMQMQSDPICDIIARNFESTIKAEMRTNHQHHQWVIQGSFNPPDDWRDMWPEQLENLKRSGEHRNRYYWARSQAFKDPKPLPYEDRVQYVERQLLHRHNNQRSPHIIHGWNYVYSQHLKDPENIDILPLNPDGEYYAESIRLWENRR